MTERDEEGVEDEVDDGMGDHLGHLGGQPTIDDPMRLAGRGTLEQFGRRTHGQQGGGHHDEQQVLDHVVVEEDALVDAEDGVGGHQHGDEATDEGHRSPPRPGRSGSSLVTRRAEVT